MQIYERRMAQVNRDMDLIRDLLLRIEGDPKLNGSHYVAFTNAAEFPGHSVAELTYHIDLLLEEGFVKGNIGSEVPLVSSLTWKGHEFLDDIRDPGVWASVKERLKELPSVGIALVWELAKAELKKKLGL